MAGFESPSMKQDNTVATSVELVEGGNIIRQGHHLTLGYIAYDELGEVVDLSDKTVDVVIWGRKGIAFEGDAVFAEGVLRFTLDQALPSGDYNVEFTATLSTDAGYRKKYPTNTNTGRISVKQSADDLGAVGISVFTIDKFEERQKELQDAYHLSVDNKVETLEADFEQAVGAITVDSEVVLARGEASTLRARLDAEKAATTQQLAEKANEDEVRKKSTKLELEDASPMFLAAVEGGEGTSFNLLSIPQKDSVDFSKMKTNGAETSFLSSDFLTGEYIELFNPLKSTAAKALSGTTGNLVDAPGNSITDFIMVPAGASLIYRANGVNGFKITGTTRKIGVWDANFNFLYNQSISTIEGFTATESVYVRIVYYDTDFGMTVKNTKTKKINSKIFGGSSAFDFYKSGNRMEFFNPAESNYNKAYSGETSAIVDATGAVISNKVFVPAGDRLIITIDGVNWVNSPAKSAGSSKLIGFDGDGNWLFTKHLSGIVGDELRFARDMYLSLQILTSYAFSLNVESFYTLDAKKIEGAGSVEEEGQDVFLFMGQSNMAGRGENAALAPNVADIAYEYKAITAPNVLSPLVEPFGKSENTADGINDGTQKTGSMVAAFAKSYHSVTGKKLIGISASKGGTGIQLWIPGTAFFTDVVNRINAFKAFADANNIKVRAFHMVWNQGEGNATMSEQDYRTNLQSIVDELKTHGIEKCFIVRVGHLRDDETALAAMIQAQTNIGRTSEDIVLVGNRFAEFNGTGLNLMVDEAHYTQTGYNLQGEQAGINTAYYLRNLKEPTMYDKEYDSLYFSHTV